MGDRSQVTGVELDHLRRQRQSTGHLALELDRDGTVPQRGDVGDLHVARCIDDL